MRKLEVQYTRSDGVVFSIETHGKLFKAGRSDINNGRLVHIPDMTDNESWSQTVEEATLMQVIVELSVGLRIFNISEDGVVQQGNNDDEDFI